MSQENVEVVQAAYRAFNDTDEEALLNLAADGLVRRRPPHVPDIFCPGLGPVRGRRAAMGLGGTGSHGARSPGHFCPDLVLCNDGVRDGLRDGPGRPGWA
jgi:hypothetical protein